MFINRVFYKLNVIFLDKFGTKYIEMTTNVRVSIPHLSYIKSFVMVIWHWRQAKSHVIKNEFLRRSDMGYTRVQAIYDLEFTFIINCTVTVLQSVELFWTLGNIKLLLLKWVHVYIYNWVRPLFSHEFNNNTLSSILQLVQISFPPL